MAASCPSLLGWQDVLKIVLGAAFSGSLHLYVWWRLVRSAHLPRRAHVALSILMLVMYLAIPITTTSRLWSPALGARLSWFSMPWMALIGLLFVVSAVLHVASAFGRLGRLALRRPETKLDMSRRV